MRRMILFATLLALPLMQFAANATAESDGSSRVVDLDRVCQPGCVVYISSEVMGEGSYKGQFKPSVIEDPLSAMSGFLRHEHELTFYQLIDEPGAPAFTSIERVRDYMNAHDKMTGTIAGNGVGGS